VIAAVGRKALAPVLGKSRFQPLFERLHALALVGLNFGEGNHPRLSGEIAVIRHLREELFRGLSPVVIFDVGANLGVYTHVLLEVFGDDAVIYAFEPAAKTFELLAQNLRGHESVRLQRVGLGAEEATATLYSAGEGSKLGSVYDTSARLRRLGLAVADQETVSLTTVDRFCEREEIEHIHLLKLDVEGHELKILEGSATMLDEGRIDVLQFEFGAANIDSRTFFRDFYDLLAERYALYRILQDGLHPLDGYKETYEVYKRATNYLALRRGLSLRAAKSGATSR
jgi:FkbM family methyltransferase